ncbi:MAG: FtsQ-type POTRA domain-containing protein [Solirubrobacteraceae bacterium]
MIRSRRALDLLKGNRIALRATLALLVVLPLLSGGWLWLRDSSFVAVRHVHIRGVHGAESIEIRSALDEAAKRMSTMDFNAAKLRSAVASFAIVGAVHVQADPPHTVSISVTERPPVAALQSAGQRTAVAADGTVLGPAWLSSTLPLVSSAIEPAVGAHLSKGFALEAVTVLGAAPSALAKHVTRVYDGPEGLTVAMGNGLLVYFGDSTRPHAKWMSLARVLASPNAAGALYVDVRLPERPAAGFTAPVTSSSASSSSSSSPSASSSASTSVATAEAASADPTAAALARRLSESAGGEAATSTSTSASTGSQESQEASSSSATGGTDGSEASTTSASTGSGASEAGGTGESETASAPSQSASATGGEAAPGG